MLFKVIFLVPFNIKQPLISFVHFANGQIFQLSIQLSCAHVLAVDFSVNYVRHFYFYMPVCLHHKKIFGRQQDSNIDLQHKILEAAAIQACHHDSCLYDIR